VDLARQDRRAVAAKENPAASVTNVPAVPHSGPWLAGRNRRAHIAGSDAQGIYALPAWHRTGCGAIERKAAPVPYSAAIAVAGPPAGDAHADGRCRSANAFCAGPAGRAVVPTVERPAAAVPDPPTIGIALWIAAHQWHTGVHDNAIPAAEPVHSRGRVLARQILGGIGCPRATRLCHDIATRGRIVCRRDRLAAITGAKPQRVPRTAEANRRNCRQPPDRPDRVAPSATAHDTTMVHPPTKNGRSARCSSRD